ncbi:MAG: bi-domain-containing oxidoreductase [Bacteroidota bacterium]|nr:bi-domain-containing oxidoreductase [Bacteroidota bacterium]
MEQLTQNLKSGHMQLLEVPFPMLNNGCVLVRNHYSIISAGTEGKTVKDARLGYVGKALARKEEVKKVIKTAKTIGLSETYKLMMNKLDAPSALGYSCAGEVIAIADDVTEFKIGDKVACAGAGAVHAEVVAIPKNLCVKLPKDVEYNEAAFTTLGAIAMQGIRQADLRLGENCAVIGLGLLGQLTIQLLNASGVKSIGIDVNSKMVELSKELGANNAYNRDVDNLENVIREITNGYGVDAVIIAAATSSNDPVDFAGEICRRKGKVIIVGSVPTGFKRTHYYKKELELKMSCSYGPGRYDTNYEEQGIDYPYGYVRWTENRNMQAFVELVQTKKINLKQLTSHVFNFNDAPKAYQLILDKTEAYTGILLKYDTSKKIKTKVELKKDIPNPQEPNIGFIGAGSFANNVLLPALKGQCNFVGIATNKGNNARNIADKYGFNYCTDKSEELMADKNCNTIFVVTRHDSHAEYIKEAIKNKKHVFVEKPLCLYEDELHEIDEQQSQSNTFVMVGFNRRFAPHIKKVKNLLTQNNKVAINYRINAGMLPVDHWIHAKTIGGGRIIGEVCHFIDLASHIANSKIISVSANELLNANSLRDTLTINLQFENGSIAAISYFSNGSKELSKEYLEIFSNGQTFIIDDFKDMTVYDKSVKKINLSNQDKGHKEEVKLFLEAIKKGSACPIPFSETFNAMLATFKVEESISKNGAQVIL